jgi:hypothetical protein
MFSAALSAVECQHLSGGHDQLISNGRRFKPAFAGRDTKQTMMDILRTSTLVLKPITVCPSIRLSRLCTLLVGVGSGEGGVLETIYGVPSTDQPDKTSMVRTSMSYRSTAL